MALFLEEYEKLRMLGKGSFASVYKVRHHDLGYIRAIKVSNDLVTDAEDHAYLTFLNECRVLLKIGNGCHPNIVRIYQPRLIANKAIVEMDYVDGVSLANYIEQKRFVEYDEFVKFATEIVGAMSYCHVDLYRFLMDPEADDLQPDPEDGSKFVIDKATEERLIHKYGVNHNDLHSNNIMRRSYDGSFVLLDFGLAIQDSHCVKSSSRGDGAYEYCSPEKLQQKSDITSASDVYSLGILLYEMLAGRVPFVMDPDSLGLEAARFQVYKAQLEETPGEILPLRRQAFESTHSGATYSRDYPEAIDRIIFKCLAKNPQDRYANAKELLMELNEVFASDKRKVASKRSNDAGSLGASFNALRKRCRKLEIDLQQSNELLSTTASKLTEMKATAEAESVKAGERFKAISQAYEDSERERVRLQRIVFDRAGNNGRSTSSNVVMWIVALVLSLIGTVVSSGITATTDYFRPSDSLPDKIASAASIVAFASMILAYCLRRRRSFVVNGLTTMLTAMGSALLMAATFAPWSYVAAMCLAGALIVFLFAWSRTE